MMRIGDNQSEKGGCGREKERFSLGTEPLMSESDVKEDLITP